MADQPEAPSPRATGNSGRASGCSRIWVQGCQSTARSRDRQSSASFIIGGCLVGAPIIARGAVRRRRTLPTIHDVRRRGGDPERVVEELDLEFSNGERRRYHRAPSVGNGAVIVLPLRGADTALLIREYAAGTHRYELGLVKGKIDPGETRRKRPRTAS